MCAGDAIAIWELCTKRNAGVETGVTMTMEVFVSFISVILFIYFIYFTFKVSARI